ncbi:MAG: SusC/RagA family TonB-linked outer membrane protein, partial [Bacteroidales bacterium]|nr:SusC/RagA family TonB-linked outer membrane protein [Bacteroidales bacterium]
PVTQSDGLQNPLWQSDESLRQNTDIRKNYRFQASALIKCPWVEGLTARFNFSYTDTDKKTSDFRKEGYFVKEGAYNDDSRYSSAVMKNLLASATGTRKYEDTKSFLFDAILNYSRTFDKHSIDATLVATRDRSTYDTDSFSGTGFVSNGNTTLGISGVSKADNFSVSQDGAETANIGYLARVMYAYDDRYSFTASYRRDGASVFGANKRWGNFWSVGAAWTPSRASFWDESIKDILTDFKIKASYGVNGNQTLAAFSTLSKISNGRGSGTRVEFEGSDIEYGLFINSMGNADLGWESTTAFNTGFESTWFRDRLDFNFDFYYSQTKDQIFTRTIPVMTGFDSVKSTMGQVDNFGIEASLHSVNIRRNDFSWTTGLTFWLNRNKLVHLYGEDLDGDGREDDDIANNRFIGKELGAIYGYVQDGIVQADDYDYIGIYNGVPGTPKYVDMNQDDRITADDRVILGYSSPSFRLNLSNTLSYTGFELYFMIAGTFGDVKHYKRSNPNAFRIMNANGYSTANLIDIPWWTPENRSNVYPAPTFSTDGRYLALQDRTFVRLQDVTFSYSLKKSLLERAKISSVKFFISGKNLLTFTKWVGDDPETGSSVLSSTLPVAKSVTFGATLSF